MLTNTNTNTAAILECDEREPEYGGGIAVWAKYVGLYPYCSAVGVLPPDEMFGERRYVLRLADNSSIYLSEEQAEAIAVAVADVHADASNA